MCDVAKTLHWDIYDTLPSPSRGSLKYNLGPETIMTAAGRSGGPLSHCTLANNLLLSIPMCDMHLSDGAERTTRVTVDDRTPVKFTDVNRLD